MNTRSLRSEAKSARYIREEVRKMKYNIARVRKWDKQWVTVCSATSLRLYKWVSVKEPAGTKKAIKVRNMEDAPQELNEYPIEQESNVEADSIEDILDVDPKRETPSPASSHDGLKEEANSSS